MENEISAVLQNLSEKIDQVLIKLSTNQQIEKSSWLSIEDAARISGTTVSGLRRRIYRERRDPKGYPLRTVCGTINRQDFEHWMNLRAERRLSRGEKVRRTLR